MKKPSPFQRMRGSIIKCASCKDRYASAKQMQRAAKQIRKLKIYLGRLTRDIKRKTLLIDHCCPVNLKNIVIPAKAGI